MSVHHGRGPCQLLLVTHHSGVLTQPEQAGHRGVGVCTASRHTGLELGSHRLGSAQAQHLHACIAQQGCRLRGCKGSMQAAGTNAEELSAGRGTSLHAV